MHTKRPMNNAVREQINSYRRKNIDITPLIKDRIIKGEDLSYCRIDNLYCVREDISGTNFTCATIKAYFQKVIAQHCNFRGVTFIPQSSLAGGDFRGSNFEKAIAIHINYSYADFRGCNLCGTSITWGDTYGAGAKLGKENLSWILRRENVI